MLRYNAEYHNQADQLAIEHGFGFAVYMGHFRECLVFIPYDNDTLYRRDDGFHYISVGKERARFHTTIRPPKGFPLEYDYLKKGRELFRELEQNVRSFNHGDPNWQNNAELYGSIRGTEWGDPHKPKVLKNDLCLFLQEGKRLGRRVLLKMVVEEQGGMIIQRCDCERYYLTLE